MKEARRRTRVDSALHFFSNRMNSSTEEIMDRVSDLCRIFCRISFSGSLRSDLRIQFFGLSPAGYLASTVAGNQSIEFLQQRLITLPGIACQSFSILKQVIQKRLDALFVQLFPVGAVSHLVEPVSVEDLL